MASQFTLTPEKKARIAESRKRAAAAKEDYDPAAPEPQNRAVPLRGDDPMLPIDLENQTMRERVASIPRSIASGLGADMTYANRLGEDAASFVDFAPLLGDAVGVDDTIQSAKRGDWWDTGINAASSLAGVAPVGGDILGKAIKKLGKGAAADTGREALTKAVRPKGEKHQISGINLRQPLDEMTFKTEPSTKQPALQDVKEFDLNAIPEGSYITKFLGDRSAGGKQVTEIGGRKVENPIELEGGIDFMRRPDASWASHPGVVSNLTRQMNTLQETGADVFGASVGMGPHAIDFSAMPLNAAMELVNQKGIPDAARDALAARMKADWGAPNKKGVIPFPAVPDFPGLEGITPDWIANNHEAAKKVVKLLDTKGMADLGGPDMGYARKIVTDPAQLDDPTGISGRRIVKAGPEAVQHLTNPEFPHADYASQMRMKGGGYAGDTEGFPLEEFWSDWMKSRPKGEAPSNTMYAFGRQDVAQKVTPEWKDRLLRLREYKLSDEGKKLGLAGAISAGIITAADAQEMFGHTGERKDAL